jgi:hypothetical protein
MEGQTWPEGWGFASAVDRQQVGFGPFQRNQLDPDELSPCPMSCVAQGVTARHSPMLSLRHTAEHPRL